MKGSKKQIQKFRVNKNRGRPAFASPRDSKILEFLWKWKFASSASIHHAVGGASSPYSTFKTLERLRGHGLIELHKSFKYSFRAWQLSDLGFDAIREDLGDLAEEGYLSENLWHDRNVLAFQLGEWPSYNIPVVQHFTEQEMRRYAAESYPAWVPQINDRRADGYTKVAGLEASPVIAYEVELSAKAISRYESIIRYYRVIRQVDLVYWLVANEQIKNCILQAKTCTKDPSDNYHVFVDLEDYRKNGWDAVVTNCKHERLFTMRGHLQAILGSKYGSLLDQMRGKSPVSLHYDPRKVIGKSKPNLAD